MRSAATRRRRSSSRCRSTSSSRWRQMRKDNVPPWMAPSANALTKRSPRRASHSRRRRAIASSWSSDRRAARSFLTRSRNGHPSARKLPLGGEDADHLEGPLHLTVAAGGEPFDPPGDEAEVEEVLAGE